MSMNLAGWSPIGMGAALLIVVGVTLLVAFALMRGLPDVALDGAEAEPEPASPRPARARNRSSQPVGIIGALLLVAGLALGILSAAGGWGTSQTMRGPGADPLDCAQAWNGCPNATVAP